MPSYVQHHPWQIYSYASQTPPDVAIATWERWARTNAPKRMHDLRRAFDSATTWGRTSADIADIADAIRHAEDRVVAHATADDDYAALVAAEAAMHAARGVHAHVTLLP